MASVKNFVSHTGLSDQPSNHEWWKEATDGRPQRRRPVQIDAGGLDGGLNIITGRKGTGKSHLAKLLLLSMAGLGAPCIVLDVNGEYVNLHKAKDGRLSTSRLTVLAPRSGINFALAKL